MSFGVAQFGGLSAPARSRPDGAVTVKASVVDTVATPVPPALILTDEFPVAALVATTNVIVAKVEPDGIVVEETRTPVGRPLTAIDTSPE